MPQEFQQTLSQIDADQFLTDLECYLRRHRFCCRCKEKVLEAYDLLIGTSCSEDDCEECNGFEFMEAKPPTSSSDAPSEDHDGELELEHDQVPEDENEAAARGPLHPITMEFDTDGIAFTSYLFDELSFCRATGQILVPCHLDFMSQLMARADNEVVGEWGDRHARTMAEAQDEVLTCLGMVLWERLQGIWTKNRCEKRAEELVIYVGITCLQRAFNRGVEALHGQEMMAQLLAEEDADTRRAARKKEKRKEKKKKRKNSIKSSKEETGVAAAEKRTQGGRVADGRQSLTSTRPLHRREDDVEASSRHAESHANRRDSVSPLPSSFSSSSLGHSSRGLKHAIDVEAEMSLLSSMGWCNLNDTERSPEMDDPLLDATQEDAFISDDDLVYWKENQSKLVRRRLEARRRLQDQFESFVSRHH